MENVPYGNNDNDNEDSEIAWHPQKKVNIDRRKSIHASPVIEKCQRFAVFSCPLLEVAAACWGVQRSISSRRDLFASSEDRIVT